MYYYLLKGCSDELKDVLFFIIVGRLAIVLPVQFFFLASSSNPFGHVHK